MDEVGPLRARRYRSLTRVQGLVVLVRLWYLVDVGSLQQQNRSRLRRPMQSRSMTM